MKKLIYLTAVAGSLLLTTSCVDLTQEPESFITEEEYWNTVDQASLEKAADALYSDLWQGNYGFNSRLQRINVCADDITYRAAKANNELAYYSRLTRILQLMMLTSQLLGPCSIRSSAVPTKLSRELLSPPTKKKPKHLKKYWAKPISCAVFPISI